MSSRGIDFANEWVQENVNVEAYDPPQSSIDEAVRQLISDAETKGISREEIEKDVGDLSDFISEAYASVLRPGSWLMSPASSLAFVHDRIWNDCCARI